MSDDDALVAMYRTMTWQDLVVLRHAFVADRREAEQEHNREKEHFAAGRITAIDSVLREYGKP